MTLSPDDIIKLLLAVVAGGVIGIERQLHHKAAGFRTITLICVGATILTLLSQRIPGAAGIASTIVTGIGFLGAGVILHESNHVTGLTTAATIWLSAAVGIGIGAGDYLLSLTTTAVALIVVRLFSRFERRIEALWEARQYQIAMPFGQRYIDKIQAHLENSGLKGSPAQTMKHQGNVLYLLNVAGSLQNQNKFVDLLMNDPDITDIEW